MPVERTTEVPAASQPVRALFEHHYGGDPDVVASAGGRVNIIGEHEDYNGGEVLPIAIEQRTYVAARAQATRRSRIVSAATGERGSFDAVAPERAGTWWDYVAGVALELRLLGLPAPPADLAIWSAVPPGAGLSSSAALEVAVGQALLALSGRSLPGEQLALVAWRAEVEFVGMPCGVMDQFASALAQDGAALHLYADTQAFEHVPMGDPVLIFDTGASRALRGSAFPQRVAECAEAMARLRVLYPELRTLAAATPAMVAAARLPPPLDGRAMHVVTERERVQAVVAALNAGRPVPGDVLLASHQSLRDDFACSTPELDWFVERATRCEGVAGARLTGAGWGGCAIAVGTEDGLQEAGRRLRAAYHERFGREARAWVTRAAGGPSVLT